MRNFTLLLTLLSFVSFYTQSQCPTNELEVRIDVKTDGFGYEAYWQLLPSGNACGVGAIFTGGNTAVGCNGGGDQSQTPGGYANNTTVNEGPWCLTDGANYDIFLVDDWGDGGTQFVVNVSGFPVYEFKGLTTDEVFTFAATGPPARDAAMMHISVPSWVEAGNIPVTGALKNVGQNTITSLDINYSIDNAATFKQSLSGLNIMPFTEYEFSHSTQWMEETVGSYSLKVWLSNVNGQGQDAVPANDELSKTINVKPPRPNIFDSYILSLNDFTLEPITSPADQVMAPSDLDFHPNGELWVTNPETENLGGSVVTFTNPGETGQTSLYRKDGNAWHFMSLPTALAFSDNGNFATSPGVFDANHDGGQPFTGPALWSSDPAIFAQPSGGNGSHLDMLHETPYGMGIAHEQGNAFWLFDAYNNDIVMYDFQEDHGPGNDDHSDGIVRRYPELAVDWINQSIPSHLVLDKKTNWLYIVDGGNQRILRMDITTGSATGTPTFGPFETLEEYSLMTGVTWEQVVTNGISEPVGIDVIDDRMIVSDHSNGDIIIYDISVMPAIEMGRISTGAAGISGIVIGPDGRIWYANRMTNEITKVEPNQMAVSAINDELDLQGISVYPNPVNASLNIDLNHFEFNVSNISLVNLSGQTIRTVSNPKESIQLDMSALSSGVYFLTVATEEKTFTKKIVKE